MIPTGYAWLKRAHDENRARFLAVQQEISSVVDLRNRVDELERAAEPARGLFGEHGLAAFHSLDIDGVRQRLQSLDAALAAAKGSGQPAMTRLIRDSVKNARAAILGVRPVAELGSDLRADAGQLGVPFPAALPGEVSLEIWDEFHRTLLDRLHWAARAHEYWHSLDRLRLARPLEQLARELTRIAEDSAQNSLELWRRWLRLWPSRWTPQERQLLGEYVSLLQMISGGDRYDEGAGRKVFRRYYSLFPKVTRLLPCWAVTSLSARGRLPFEPRVFDVVVIDEASQCDIASALPLLFRARRAVIIGDPLQLKHVSTVAPAAGPADPGGPRPRGRPRHVGVFGEFVVRPRAQPLPARGHREPARPSPLASRHHLVFEPAFLPRQIARGDRS